MYTMRTSRWHCCSCVQLNRSRLMTVRPLLNVVGDCIHLSRASLAVRFLGHEKKRLSHFIRSTWNNYCMQCGDVAGNTNSAVLFDIFIAEHLFTSSCVRVFWTCPENGTFGWLVSHTEWRLIEIIWLCLWSRIGGGGQACNFIELHRFALYWALYMLCTIYVKLQDQWNGPYFFLKKSYLSPRWTKLPQFFFLGEFSHHIFML